MHKKDCIGVFFTASCLLPRMCSGKVLFFTCLQWPCQEKNKSKSHSLRWVTLCSARVFEWQHKDGLSFPQLFLSSSFFCTATLTKTDCETGAFRDTSYTSFKVLQLTLLSARRKKASDASSWCHYWSPQLTWSDYHGLKIPYRFQSFLGILHGSENSSDNHSHVTRLPPTLINENDHVTLE